MEDIDNYTLVDKTKNKHGEDTTELKQNDGRFIIQQYSGLNTDNFVIKKIDGQRLNFSFFKINGIYYVNINGEHIIDYKRFINIQQISMVEVEQFKTSIKIRNGSIGDLIIHNCDAEMFLKSLNIMQKHMKNKSSYYNDFMYLMFH